MALILAAQHLTQPAGRVFGELFSPQKKKHDEERVVAPKVAV